MRVLFSEQAHKFMNSIFNYKVYLTDNKFCQSFISYIHDVAQDFNTLSNGKSTYSSHKGYRRSRLSKIDVYYRVINTNTIAIYSIGFIGLPRLYRLCAFERKELGITRRKKPTHIRASGNPSDYRIYNEKGGIINGTNVYVVKRIDMTTQSNKPLFNYLYKGRILSKYDFLSTTPFTMQNDGSIKAYADAANGRRYWLYPNGKIRLYENNDIMKRLKQYINECVREMLNEGISNVVYHFCAMDELLKMLKTDKFYFGDQEKEYSNGMNFISTTRQRNSVQGYPFMMSGNCPFDGGTERKGPFDYYFIRVQLNGQALQNTQYSYRGKHTTIKGGPFDYISHEFDDEPNGRRQAALAAEQGTYDDGGDAEIDMYNQPYAQAEDRLYSKKKTVEGFKKCVERIDILIREDKLLNDDLNKVIRFLFNVNNLMKSYGQIIHVYNKRSSFDLQRGDEVSEEYVIGLIKKLKRLIKMGHSD